MALWNRRHRFKNFFKENYFRTFPGRFWLSIWTGFYAFLILCTRYVEVIRVSDFHLILCYDVCIVYFQLWSLHNLIKWFGVSFCITSFLRIFIEDRVPAVLYMFHLIVYGRVCLSLLYTPDLCCKFFSFFTAPKNLC